MDRKTIYWISQLCGWTFFILINILYAQLTDTFYFRTVVAYSILFVLGLSASHLYRKTIIRFHWLKLSIFNLVPRVILSCLFLGIVTHILQNAIEDLFYFNEQGELNVFNIKELVNIQNALNLSYVYFFWSLIYFLFHYLENYKKAEIENLKWSASINEIELNKLKSQLNPHFIFNSMNSIRALVDENPKKAKESITQLSNILRNTLQIGKKKVIPFDEEFKLVKDYIDLEATRFEERLKINFTIDNKSNEYEVPPLMIQTLVENGIKHGISQLMQGGNLEISTQVNENKLHVHICNSGQINGSIDTENGFGIKNTIQRLYLLYGDRASLKIFNETAHSVRTELIIPKLEG